MGHLQPRTLVHCDNAMAVAIANNLIKRQLLHSMEMKFFWVGNKIALYMYGISWHPGQENLAKYQGKHHPEFHHVDVRVFAH
jgi:hypothetical protein